MHQKLVWRAGRYDHIDDIAAGRPVGQLSDAQVTLYEIVPTQNSIRINLRIKKLLFLLQGKDNGETRYLSYVLINLGLAPLLGSTYLLQFSFKGKLSNLLET